MRGLLLVIIAILLFGSGAVLGFFNTIFWIIVCLSILVGGIWFIYSLPKITKTVSKEIIEDQKQAYAKHPTGVIISVIFLVIFILVWLISTLNNQSSRDSINTQFQSQYTPDLSTTQPEETSSYKHLNVDKARAAGATDVDIQKLLIERPDVHVYPETNRNAFLTSCNQKGDNITEYCYCALTYFEARYTIEEYTLIEAEYINTQKSEAISNAMNYCTQ